MDWQGRVRPGWAWPGWAWFGGAGHGEVFLSSHTRPGPVWRGVAGQGSARIYFKQPHGAGSGSAGLGKAR